MRRDCTITDIAIPNRINILILVLMVLALSLQQPATRIHCMGKGQPPAATIPQLSVISHHNMGCELSYSENMACCCLPQQSDDTKFIYREHCKIACDQLLALPSLPTTIVSAPERASAVTMILPHKLTNYTPSKSVISIDVTKSLSSPHLYLTFSCLLI